MKSIRRIALTAAVVLSAFGATTYTSCNTDECKDVVCANGGTCNSTDGSCSCATGYEGATCATEQRAKFIKSWSATDTEVGGSMLPSYSSIVVSGTSVTEVRIAGFSDDYFTNNVVATVSGNTITIANQTPDNDGYKVSGSGTLNSTDGKLTWSYTITNPLNVAKTYSGTWQ